MLGLNFLLKLDFELVNEESQEFADFLSQPQKVFSS